MGAIPITPYRPQPSDPLEQYGKALSVRDLMQRGQLQQQEIIAATRQNEQTQAINSAYHDAITMDESGQPKIDSAKLTKALAANGHGSAVPGILKSIQDYQKSATELQEAKGKIQTQAQESLGFLGSAIQKANYDPHLADLMIEQHLRSPNASPQEVSQLQQMRSAIAQNPTMLKTLADSYVAQAPKQQEFQNSKDVANIRAQSVEKMEMNSWLQANPGKTPADYQQFKVQQGVDATVAKETNPQVLQARKDLAVSTAKAEIPGKVEAAREEATVKQQIEGKVKPGYAFEPETGRTILTSQTDFLNSGGKLQAFRPVTEKEVSDDRQLNNRLSDVALKLQRYQDASQKDLPSSDQYVMSKILGDDKFKLGLMGAEVPVDFLNKLDKAGYLNNMSTEGQKRLIAYLNAKEAMQGYQRVLTGSGRSSIQAMQLNLDALPNPLMHSQFVNESIGQFRENLKTAAQGLPTLPGIKSPDDVVKGIAGSGNGHTKTLTHAAIRQAAKDNGISEAEAEKQAREQGYAVQ